MHKFFVTFIQTEILYLQITEEDERTSSRNSMDKEYVEKLKSQMDKEYVEKLKSQISKEETSSIVESEDGVAKIHIGK